MASSDMVNIMDNLPKRGTCNQYCLKWNNHKLNISGVFERLRSSQQFCDLTLTSADQKFLKCHRLLLCAGSGYLEEILTLNPSDHPTVVLSQIDYDEMKLLVDFMYSGEVSVETEKLGKLLEAAKILKIKGLWESDLDENLEEDEEEETASNSTEEARAPVTARKEERQQLKVEKDGVSVGDAESPGQVKGSKKRKLKSLHIPIDTKPLKEEESGGSPNHSEILTPKSDVSNPKVYSPMFGVSNAYFLTAHDQKPPNEVKVVENGNSLNLKLLKDMPQLLAQTPVHPALISAIAPDYTSLPPFLPALLDASNAKLHHKEQNDESSPSKPKKAKKAKIADRASLDANNRRYKQYTDDTLLQALREIMAGQSINRSSMKYNIPARTLRDWMKRLNIKSAFTQNHNGCPSNDHQLKVVANGGSRNLSTESDFSSMTNSSGDTEKSTATVNCLPRTPPFLGNPADMKEVSEEEEEEVEIDDDEEHQQVINEVQHSSQNFKALQQSPTKGCCEG